MGKIIIKDAVKRREGYIYYIDGEGSVCEAVSAIGKGKRPKKKAKASKTAKPVKKKTATKKKK